MLERQYQTILIKRLRKMFPGCVVMKNDSSYAQGFPDLTILYKNKWAVLEVKANERFTTEPNQEYYIQKLNGMSFAAFIYPENERDVIHALQLAFASR